MSIVEQATKRLEQLARAGVSVPWAAGGLAPGGVQQRVEAEPRLVGIDAAASALQRRIDEPAAARASARPLRAVRPLEGKHSVVLDLPRLERLGHLVPTQTRSPLTEEFRHIKRPLVRNARSPESAARRLPLIMVTSALPREGKTFCAINLAMSVAAEIDTSVLLVDADVVRPEVLQRLGIEAERGLLDVLSDPDLDLADVVLKTNVPKLSILPAGRRNTISTELLASEAMDELLESLVMRHPDQIVVFDAPPLLVTNEATVLASRVGQVVLVVEAAQTQRSVVARALAAVEQCPVVMSLLNKAPESAARLGYGYYYG